MYAANKIIKILAFFAIIASYTICDVKVCMAADDYLFESNQIQGGLDTTYDDDYYSSGESIDLNGSIDLRNGNQLITVSLRDSDVKQVLRMFADKAGLNIVFHNSVDGQITLDLVGVTLNKAMEMISQMAELSYVVENGTLLVMKNEAAKTLKVSKQNIHIIPVKYANSVKVADFLNKNIFGLNKPGLSNSETAVSNPSQNEVLIFGTENDYKMALNVVRVLDKKPKTTTFKVNHTTPKEMGKLICESLFLDLTKKSGGDSNTFSGFQQITDADSPQNTVEYKTQQAQVTQQTQGAQMGQQTGQFLTTTGVVVGGGVVACQVSGDTDSKELKSFSDTSLTIMYLPQVGTINMIGGSQAQIDMVSDFIKKNDKKQAQAFVEVSIIELTDAGSKEFNNTWNVYSRWFSGSIGGNGLATGTNTPIFWGGTPGKLNNGGIPGLVGTMYKWGTSPIISQSLNYLIENNKGRVLATPKILITNGQNSTIDLSSDYVKKVTSEILQTGSVGMYGGTQKEYEIGNDNGMKIAMVPFISPDGYVSLNIKPMYATIKESVFQQNQYGEQELAATLLQRRNLDLKGVRIKDGETLVLGGLIQESETQNVSKTPLLGDIPVLGFFFRNSQKETEKSELVITITPHIIKDTDEEIIETEDL